MIQLKVFVVILILRPSVLAENLIVKTPNGQVQGRERKTIENKVTFYSFNGIPYAQPPIGNLRLAAPLPADSWDDVLDATEDKPHCVANDFILNSKSSEDCLYVNVYTPQNPNSCSSPLPVLVWIFGGGFIAGEASFELDGPDYFIEKDVIMVSFNYRLGVFGFLSTEDEVIPGNFGFKDQVLALKWVQNNIASFCGNASKVTVIGQSAGAAAVAYHIQSQQSEGLFQQAIMHSGTSLNLWALSRRAKKIALETGELLDLDTSSSQSLLDGLRNVSLISLATFSSASNMANLINNNAREGLGFSPVIEPEHEGAFFTKNSFEALKSGNFSHVPIIIGHTSFETNIPLLSVVGIARPYLLQFDFDNRKLLPIDFNINPDKAFDAAKEIKKKYFNSLPVSLSSLPLLKFITVDQFERPIEKYAKLVQNFTDVYFYRFSYEGGLGSQIPKAYPGVFHGSDMAYFFRDNNECTEQDKIVRDRAVTLWSNFIKNGNPTPTQDPNLQNIIWKPFNDEESYLEISDSLNVTNFPNKDMVQFWDQFFIKYANPPHSTY